MIKATVWLFTKTLVKSTASSAVVVGAFLVGREYGKFDMGKKYEKSTSYGDVVISRDGMVKEPISKENN